MAVNNVSSSYNLSALDPLLSTETQSQAGVTNNGDSDPQVSEFAKLMKELQELQQNDPDKFKQVMSSIASTLSTDASNATGGQAQFLTQLADKFQQAAQTGSMASLEPSGSVSGQHGHHRHVQSYSSQQQVGASSTAQQPTYDLALIIQNAIQEATS